MQYTYVDDLYTPDVLLLKLEEACKADIRVHIDEKIYINYNDGQNNSIIYSIDQIAHAATFVYNILR